MLCWLCALPVAGQDSGSDEAQTEVVRGTVINAVTQEPISRALVFSPDNRHATLTDGDGHFEFTVPVQSSGAMGGFVYSGPQPSAWPVTGHHIPFPLVARKPGFLDCPDQVGEISSSDEDIKIPLLPEGIIKGKVTATGGEPATGITVQLFSREVQEGFPRWIPGHSSRANSAGEYRFAELLPGSYKIVTHEWMDNDPAESLPGEQMYGFPPVYYPGVGEFAAAATIELSAGQTVQADLPIVRRPYYQVRIPVANRDISNGLDVSVRGEHGSRYELSYNQGEQRIEGMLPGGSYVVEVATYGPNSVSGSVNIRVDDAPLQGPALALTPNTPIVLNVKEEFTDTTWSGSATFALPGGRTFSVRGPRAYLQASVESADDLEQHGGSLRPPAAPNDQALLLEALPPGRYWLRLWTGRGYVASATMGSTDLLHQSLVVGAQSSAPIEITLRDDGAELDGTINSAAEQNVSSGSAAERAWLYCVPLSESAGQFQEVGVSEDGRFTAQMAPGDYRILAFSKVQRLPYRDAEAMKPYETKGEVVHLSAGQKTSVQVQIIRAE